MMVGRATAQRRRFSFSRRQRITFGGLLLAVCFLACPGLVLAQVDICGCIGHPNNLGDFNTADEATYPPGTILSNFTITIPLPDDGILIFDSFTVGVAPSGSVATVQFEPNEINTPVTILVTGDVTIGELSCCSFIHVNGQAATSGSSSLAGRGGLGGPGGFRGGDGAYQLANGASEGGAGFGPKGGLPGTASPLTDGLDGEFAGVRELLPLIGGGGGGGGASNSNATSCSGSGGGGGGGGLLIAANGIITVNSGGQIQAKGGTTTATPGGSAGCASRGGGGGGGAIRLVASTITGTGSITATGGSGSSSSAGFIRLEAFNDTYTGNVNPVAMRFPGPGPLSNPLRPTVAITAVNGEIESIGNGKLIAQRPQGALGLVDIRLAAPGTVDIDLETTNIPIGTLVEVTVKPRIGGAPVVLNATLQDANCEATGMCVASVAVNLTPGAYVIEARATFATP